MEITQKVWHEYNVQIQNANMNIIAVIMDSVDVEKILKHLVKTGKSPPGICVDELCMVS